MNTVIDRIKKAMSEKNITMNVLVEKTNLKRSTLYYILEDEENIKKTKIETLFAIASALDVSIDYIMYGDNIKNETNNYSMDENNMTPTEKLKMIIANQGYNINTFSKKAELPYMTVKNVLERGIENSSINTVITICKALDMTVDDLLETPGDKYSLDESNLIKKYRSLNINSKQIIQTLIELELRHLDANAQGETPIKILNTTKKELDARIKQELRNKPTEQAQYIKVYTQSAAAGYGNYLTDDESFDMVQVPSIPRGVEFGIRISGNSMKPKINHGDIVFVHRQPSVDIGDIGIFIIEGDAYCKQLLYKNDRYCLHSLNEDYKDIYFTDDTAYCVGKVIF
ncbi:MAG: helix-turn-helix domain-containing protein [Clostridiales bacterium]|jgi:phage repressor protein C with HTH and peptisase S24 domain/DNA-binding Xre family transcriptional regulator|nr:helix-turn-helix domain-containing protein [Clostridiales bacterium]